MGSLSGRPKAPSSSASAKTQIVYVAQPTANTPVTTEPVGAGEASPEERASNI